MTNPSSSPASGSDPARGVDASLRIERFGGEPTEWDDFVRSIDGWTHFHLWGWKRVMEEALRHDCPYLAARNPHGDLRGTLPLVRVKSPLFGHYLVSIPFLNYGGPLGSAAAIRSLTSEAEAMAERDGADLLELRSRQALPLELPVSHRKVTVVLDLPGDPETLWKDLKSKVRSQVRRPRKEGVDIRFGHDQVDAFHEVFARHMHTLGTPALPRELFETLPDVFGEDVWFGCAYLGEQPVACGAGFRWEDEFEMTWASDLVEHRRIAPNMLLYWSFMERAIEHGLSVFNFGRCSPGSGTHRFKQQWGTRDEQLWWYRNAAGELESTPSPDDGPWSWAPRVWSRMPRPLVAAVGPLLARLIP